MILYWLHQPVKLYNYDIFSSKSDDNSEGACYCGHDTKTMNQLKNMYKKCRICRSCLRWPFAKTVECQSKPIEIRFENSFLTTLYLICYYIIIYFVDIILWTDCFLISHETCMKSIICPLGEKSDDRPMNIFESEVCLLLSTAAIFT